MATSLNTYQDVQNFFNNFVTANQIDIGDAPHGDFWNTLTYDQFVNGNVPGVAGPIKILVKGNASNSNLVAILKGSIPSPAGGTIPRMPPGGPYMSDDMIATLADWINRNCPNPSPTTGTSPRSP